MTGAILVALVGPMLTAPQARAQDAANWAGVQLAYPSQMEYSASDLPIDEEKRRAAEEKIRAWRAEENLPFPDFDAAEKSEIADTLDYPPEGSVLRRPPAAASTEDATRPATDRNR